MTAPRGGGGANSRSAIVKVSLVPWFASADVTVFGNGFAAPVYWLDTIGALHLEGAVAVANVLANKTLFNVPVALLPLADRLFATWNNNMQLHVGAAVLNSDGAQNPVGLDGIMWTPGQ